MSQELRQLTAPCSHGTGTESSNRDEGIPDHHSLTAPPAPEAPSEEDALQHVAVLGYN